MAERVVGVIIGQNLFIGREKRIQVSDRHSWIILMDPYVAPVDGSEIYPTNYLSLIVPERAAMVIPAPALVEKYEREIRKRRKKAGRVLRLVRPRTEDPTPKVCA